MEPKNKLLIAAAGSGKTQYIIENIFEIIKKNSSANILVTTYTRTNAEQIRQRIKEFNRDNFKDYSIPKNIIIQEWFSFLLEHGVRPFKSMVLPELLYKNIDIYHDFQYNNNLYIKRSEILGQNFLGNHIIANSLSDFTLTVEEKTSGLIFSRIENIYSHIFIDEVQDLAGYDLNFLKKLFGTKIETTMVGDPRQTTYVTPPKKENSQYKDGKIVKFITDKCKDASVCVDTNTLSFSHRNNKEICDFSSALYPDFEKSLPCICEKCRVKDFYSGIYICKESKINEYSNNIIHKNIGVLRHSKSKFPERNFGDSKGLTYDHIIIHPTKPIIEYLKSGNLVKIVKNKKGILEERDALDIPRFYVAVTRAKYSVAIVYDYKENETFKPGVQLL